VRAPHVKVHHPTAALAYGVRVVDRSLRLLAPSLLLALCLSGCGDDSPEVTEDLSSLCGLTAMPRASYEERRAVLADAQRRLGSMSAFKDTPQNKAISKAVAEVIASISIETPPDWPGAPLVRPANIPTLKAALTRLETACR